MLQSVTGLYSATLPNCSLNCYEVFVKCNVSKCYELIAVTYFILWKADTFIYH